MTDWINLQNIQRFAVVCICGPFLAIVATLLILAARGRRQVIKNQRDTWLRW